MIPIIIDFEGLDCSFKETNSKALTKLFGDLGKRYEFPNYGSNSSYIKKINSFLAGEYPNIQKTTIIDLFMEEQAHEWFNTILPDIKNGIKYVILDRFWVSNLYYYPLDFHQYIYDTRKRLKLPYPSYVVNMMTDLDLMLKSVHEKNSSNDIIEGNDRWLTETYSRFKRYLVCAQTIDINIVKDGKYRTREDIFQHEITDIYGEVIHHAY